MLDPERDYFYWRNSQGVPERHHISEIDRVIFGRTGKPQNTPGKDPGKPVCSSGGENIPKADCPQAVGTTAGKKDADTAAAGAIV
jgi:hypothetical protein